MSLSFFHPVVATWFARTFGEPTPPQRRGWAAIRAGRHTLIAAPTGSGKTLAAFLSALDDLVRDGSRAPLPDEVRVVYVSPLKALSADIHKNLAEPRRGIRQTAEALGLEAPRITAAVRTGDTTPSERAAMLRTPPHILVTTPESLFLLLTAERSRQMLRTARTVIVDEIHAVIGTRRGAHLALSLERLESIAHRPLQRIGLSATQRPVEEVARYLVGTRRSQAAVGQCAIVDDGHRRAIDLGVEIPRSPLGTVLAQEVWEEYYDRLAELIGQHRTTLVFVNTRRLAERLSRHLGERVGESAVKAHHGSLSKAIRLDAEHGLKTGALKALVATASLELGIDIGHVDLVCQIGSPHRIATLLQRVGRSGHSMSGLPKGRLFPVSRNDLLECAALLGACRRGELDCIVAHDAPLDVLAQQIAAEVSCGERGEDDLFELMRGAWPYRHLARAEFDAVLAMLAEGYSTRRGRHAALLHRDEVHRRVRGRRGTRLLAMTSGGAIPEAADYRVVLEPDDTFIGTLNEDFAIESMVGDVFQLGNASWRVIQVTAGTVRVADAQGAPPNIPFWLGEAPTRSDELSRAVSDLCAEAARILEREPEAAKEADSPGVPGPRALAEWLERETGLTGAAAGQLAAYLEQGRRALGAIPTQDTVVAERFFDESGGMQLVLHAPFGSRINRAWALALRKRFCRQFNFELQAAATEDAILLSLGPQHSFPLADVFRYLHPASVRDVLVQALLDAPLFRTRWRWNATISLAVPRNRGGRKVPPQLQRMQADDLLAAVFPDAAACLENLPGDRVVPNHPLVNQTIRDCLHEAMDLDGLECLLERIHTGQVRCLSRDTPEPSPFADEVLNARPYTFLDDAPLEERRAQAVQARAPSARGGEPMRALDASAIARVRDEERPDPRDADQLHDALLTAGFLLEHECDPTLLRELAKARRAARVVIGPLPDRTLPGDAGETTPAAMWVAAERLPEMTAVHPGAEFEPPIAAPPSRAARVWPREAALAELLRDRLGIEGPVTAARLAAVLSVTPPDVEAALTILESEGVVLRGRYTPGEQALEWCDRRLLARIHRYTLDRLRSEIAPVPAADFMRFLLAWHHVAPGTQLTGIDGVRAVVAQLDGLQLPARAWERDVLPARVDSYDPSMLDLLCLTGEVGWARLSSGPAQMAGTTPVALFLREHADAWFAVHADDRAPAAALSDAAAQVLAHLCAHGASFAADIGAACELAGDALRGAIGELASAGLVASDGFAGLRELVRPGSDKRPTRPRRTDAAGRWWALRTESRDLSRDEVVEMAAWALLRRYGVVLRRLMLNESMPVPWRDLVRVYRRLEARGEIRGGRFVSGLSGEQFALPEAVEHLREIRRLPPDNRLIVLSAADPLNLTGIVTHDDRIRAVAGNRILYRNGIVVAAMEGGVLRSFGQLDPPVAAAAAAALAGRRVPVVSGFVGTRR